MTTTKITITRANGETSTIELNGRETAILEAGAAYDDLSMAEHIYKWLLAGMENDLDEIVHLEDGRLLFEDAASRLGVDYETFIKPVAAELKAGRARFTAI